MNQKITPQQSTELFYFCHRHFVYQYDLQCELVDHLASSIEEQWENNPALTFKEALHASFSKFGITGFSKIKQQKQRELRRKYNLLQWKYLLEFYRWPKMIMTLAFTLALFILLQIVEDNFWVLIPYFTILAAAIVYYYFRIFPKKYKIKTKPGKSFMLLNHLKQEQYSAIVAVQVPFHIINFRNLLNAHWLDNNVGLFVISLLIITLTISLYGNLFYYPKKIKEHFMEQYAEFAV